MFGLLGPERRRARRRRSRSSRATATRDAGTVEVLGVDPQRSGTPWRQRIGVMLQSSSLYPNLTARESLAVFAGYYARPRDVDEVIEIVGLAEKAHARVRTLSGGQQRRLDLGLALVGDPELVFLDEPTTGFDPGARRTAWETVRNLRALGKTILLTTHYLDEAEQLADRVAVLRDGVIVREGSPADLTGGDRRDRDPLQARRPRRRRAHEGPDAPAPRADGGGARPRRGARRARGATPDARGRLPGADQRVKLFLHELKTEQVLFWRNREAAFFTFFLPVIFFLVFGSIYGDSTITKEHIKAAPFLEAGMIGYGVASTAFAGLAITMVIRRESGVLKRIRATPLPPWTYLVAVLASTFVTFLVEAILLIVLGRLLFSVAFPTRPLSLFLALVVGRGRVRRDGARADRVRPLGGGVVGGRELRLSADGDHLRHVLHPEGIPRVPPRDRRRAAAHLLHEADARRDGAPPPHLVGDRLARRSCSSGA